MDMCTYVSMCVYEVEYGTIAGLDKQNFECKIVNIFIPISFNVCFGCSKEPSYGDVSFECQQQMFWLEIRKLFFRYTLN